MPYKTFLIEAIKVTVLCALIAFYFGWAGASHNLTLLMFTMGVLACAATFSPAKKSKVNLALGGTVVLISITLGGLLGHYMPLLAKVLMIIYAALAFYLPKTNDKRAIFVNSALMFLVFTYLNFDAHIALTVFLHGIAVMVFFFLYFWLVEAVHYRKVKPAAAIPTEGNRGGAIVVALSLIIGSICVYFLKTHTAMSHVFWVNLTIMMVVQGSWDKTIKTSILRVLTNSAGALIIIALFSYVIPPVFWINLVMLGVFLFLIFALGFSYIFRVLFIEMFVLGFAHLAGDFHNYIAYDRIILTLIGGVIVIVTTLYTYWLLKNKVPSSNTTNH